MSLATGGHIEVGEAGISALVAGYFGVPVVMVSGDEAAVTEMCEKLLANTVIENYAVEIG